MFSVTPHKNKAANVLVFPKYATLNINIFSPKDLNMKNLALFLVNHQGNNPQNNVTIPPRDYLYTHTPTSEQNNVLPE